MTLRRLLAACVLMLWPSLAGAAGTVFLTDSFTDADGAELTAHTGELGSPWIEHPIYAADGAAVITGNRLRGNADALTVYYNTTVPDYPHMDSAITFEVVPKSLGAGYEAGVIARAAYAVPRYYRLAYSTVAASPGWYLYGIVDGAPTLLGTPYITTLTVDQPYTVRFELLGENLTVKVDGTTRITASQIIDITDNAGHVGVYTYGTMSATTGLHISYIEAENLSATGSGLPRSSLRRR